MTGNLLTRGCHTKPMFLSINDVKANPKARNVRTDDQTSDARCLDDPFKSVVLQKGQGM